MKLVTHQTGPQGKEVNRVYVEAGIDIDRELYLGMLVDRGASRVVVMASTEGGMEIENVARDTPEKIIKVTIDPATGLMPYHARRIVYGLGLEGDQVSPALKFIAAMYRAFVELDASIVEINPLVVTKSGEVMALDAKMNFDDNALFRHKEVEELRDESEEEPAELEAAKHGLNYIKLDGNIGCMVNGAGLAMATMDIIKLYGGAPANFLDVGGGATRERVTTAFKLILSDPNVEGILVNIFGGIMRCDVIAEGVVAAAREISLGVPLVVRLEGTNVELGKKILQGIRPADPVRRPSGRRRREDRQSREGSRLDGRPRRPQHQGHLPGLHRRPGHLPLRAGHRLRHLDGGRRHPRQGRHAASRPAGLRHGGQGGGGDRGDGERHLCAAALRRRRHPGGDRCPGGSRRLHHRGHPGARHGAGQARPPGQRHPADRAQLPRDHHPRRMQDRHHARPYPQPREGRHRLALRHPHL